MVEALRSRIGFEVELLAPRGSSRQALADELARRCDGLARPVWHEDSEPALIRSLGGRFLHLTKGFEVIGPSGQAVCRLVDDVTLVADLDAEAASAQGWHRLLTDDPRLLRLLARLSDPAGPIEKSLDEAASLWGVRAERIANVWRVETDGATIALAAPSGGERERPCEIVTPPIAAHHLARLDELLDAARLLRFTVPREAAVHLHFDGAPFRSLPVFANVVRLFAHWREPLRQLLATNPACRRLAPLPDSLVAAVERAPTWDDVRAAAKAGELSKFFDVNLTQLLRDDPVRDTLEVRILPGTLDASEVVDRASLVEGLLGRCRQRARFPLPPADLASAIAELRRLAG